jgi:hypothetical protein
MNKKQLEIKSDFDKFKIGLTNRIINNYEHTNERNLVIDKIKDIKLEQAIKNNIICKEIFPILWDATPPQNEKNYCYNSQTIFVRIMCNDNEELKVRSYFHGNLKGNSIKGCFLQSEINDAINNIDNAIKEAARREVLEESNIILLFIDDNSCSLNIYDNIIVANYKIITNNNKHIMTIRLTLDNYELLKECFTNNLEKHKTFMENTGEISGLIL